MRPRSTELLEYLKRQAMVREEIKSLIRETVDARHEDGWWREEALDSIADRWLTVIQAVCNVRPMVIEETDATG